jgi:CRISPR/Cas system Type II protein with McrA/HNH and RuvC-like nuclease domain
MKIPTAKIIDSKADLQLAFDVGHSSLGWAVLQTTPEKVSSIDLLGCGVVTFRSDDCLASARRGYRRQRRHIEKKVAEVSRGLALLLRAHRQIECDNQPAHFEFFGVHGL